MVEIRLYSSGFSTKINHVLDCLGQPAIQHGRLKAIEALTQEKESTINNWLFSGKLPRVSKRLAISDAIGVSYDYLFDDEVAIDCIAKPEIFWDGRLYWVPFIEAERVFELGGRKIVRVERRLPIMFPGFDERVSRYGKRIYLTTLAEGGFGAHVEAGACVVYSENLILEHFGLVLHRHADSGEISARRVVLQDGRTCLEYMEKNGELICRPLREDDQLLSILLTYSR
ncbi:hypothetical protein ABGV49_13260 [Chromobacterium vaccinii]|uniref:XRE family transcriptional regulator n=1 Tax=Chromobacterium vaccinii TaxID=1108595 RepID=A0ABV0FD80_9NEIS